jgi:hypothetical protein
MIPSLPKCPNVLRVLYKRSVDDCPNETVPMGPYLSDLLLRANYC